ncbi:hypothetical protein EYF80_005911 [Liparis tanakae]|uniref:Uncharacterized protein n=1 Tax=Liparis tanakae TaxID=230148 RepID=A0A4Z2J081_9TELE|nr:hypothetical protein EYF80_005911 [Liparis tanakae]
MATRCDVQAGTLDASKAGPTSEEAWPFNRWQGRLEKASQRKTWSSGVGVCSLATPWDRVLSYGKVTTSSPPWMLPPSTKGIFSIHAIRARVSTATYSGDAGEGRII